MIKQEATNTFEGGIMLDQNPSTTKNNVLSNALNATLITMAGDEYVLQNDLGNGRVDAAYLPYGYVPIGMLSYGGIIYVASCNPNTGYAQIGSFPSPKRLLSSSSSKDSLTSISIGDFVDENNNVVRNYVSKQLFGGKKINPGDFFYVYEDYKQDYIEYYLAVQDSNGVLKKIDNSIDFSGGFTYDKTNNKTNNEINVDTLRDYRAKIQAFNSKISGPIFLVGKLKSISEINISISNIVKKEDGTGTTISFNISADTDDSNVLWGVNSTTLTDNNYELSVTQTSGIISYNIVPYIKINNTNYNLPDLATSGSINLDLIGTGTFNIDSFDYIAYQDYLRLTIDYNMYPAFGTQMGNVSIQYIDLIDTYANGKSLELSAWKWNTLYTFPNKASYYASYATKISYNSSFQYNKMYIMRVQYQKDLKNTTVNTYSKYYLVITRSYTLPSNIISENSYPQFNTSISSQVTITEDGSITQLLDYKTDKLFRNSASQDTMELTKGTLNSKTFTTKWDYTLNSKLPIEFKVTRSNTDPPISIQANSVVYTYNPSVSGIYSTTYSEKLKNTTTLSTKAISEFTVDNNSTVQYSLGVNDNKISLDILTLSKLFGNWEKRAINVDYIYDSYISSYNWQSRFSGTQNATNGFTFIIYGWNDGGPGLRDSVYMVPVIASGTEDSTWAIQNVSRSGWKGPYSIIYRDADGDYAGKYCAINLVSAIKTFLTQQGYTGKSMFIPIYMKERSSDGELIPYIPIYKSSGTNRADNKVTYTGSGSDTRFSSFCFMLWYNNDELYLVNKPSPSPTSIFPSNIQTNLGNFLVPQESSGTINLYTPTQNVYYQQTGTSTFTFKIAPNTNLTASYTYQGIDFPSLYSGAINKLLNDTITQPKNIISTEFTAIDTIEKSVTLNTEGFDTDISSLQDNTLSAAAILRDSISGEISSVFLTDDKGNDLQKDVLYQYSKTATGTITGVTKSNSDYLAVRNRMLVPKDVATNSISNTYCISNRPASSDNGNTNFYINLNSATLWQ